MSLRITFLLAGVFLTGCVLPPKESAHPETLKNIYAASNTGKLQRFRLRQEAAGE